MPSAPPYSSGPANGHHISASTMMGQMTNGGQQSVVVSNSIGPGNNGGPGGGAGGGISSPHHHLNQSQQMLTNEECGIREVWANNLEEEFKIIRNIVQHYPYIAMDTEFPGVVARPIGTFTSNTDYVYQVMQVNVQLLKIIQLGLTFMDASGKTPSNGYSTWQFNFKFSLSEDMFAQESIDLLTNSGLQFKKHEEEGIDTYEFAVLLIGSGIVLSDNIYWLSFHSGYDFGYLLKLLTDQPLPTRDTEFFELLRIYFPRVYDLKYLMKSIKDLKGGLQEVAEQLSLERKGPQHQAGSDSLLTGETFFRMREMYFEDNIEEKRYSGFIYGLELVENGNASGGTGSGTGGGGGGNTGNSSSGGGQGAGTNTTSSTSTNQSTTSSTTTTTAPANNKNLSSSSAASAVSSMAAVHSTANNNNLDTDMISTTVSGNNGSSSSTTTNNITTSSSSSSSSSNGTSTPNSNDNPTSSNGGTTLSSSSSSSLISANGNNTAVTTTNGVSLSSAAALADISTTTPTATSQLISNVTNNNNSNSLNSNSNNNNGINSNTVAAVTASS